MGSRMGRWLQWPPYGWEEPRGSLGVTPVQFLKYGRAPPSTVWPTVSLCTVTVPRGHEGARMFSLPSDISLL